MDDLHEAEGAHREALADLGREVLDRMPELLETAGTLGDEKGRVLELAKVHKPLRLEAKKTGQNAEPEEALGLLVLRAARALQVEALAEAWESAGVQVDSRSILQASPWTDMDLYAVKDGRINL